MASAESAKGIFSGVCGYCKKRAGHKHKDCPECKAKQGGSGSRSGSGSGSGSGTKYYLCGKDGHTDADCWKEFPDNSPNWYKDLSKKGEAAGSSVEVVLATVDKPNSKEQDFHGDCL